VPDARAIAVIAAVPSVSLIAALVLGGTAIRVLRRAGAGQRIRDDGPQRHLKKEGTPTMGGILIIAGTLAAALGAAIFREDGYSLPLIMLAGLMLAFGVIGFLDDWLKIRRGRSLGMRAREKLALQVIAAVAFAGALWAEAGSGGHSGVLVGARLPGYAWVGFWGLAVVGTSNAVNLADGLDGLAGGLCVIAGVGFAVVGGTWEVQTLGLALAGACLGFLWFNLHPARLFMGDVGSLALGAAIAGMAAVANNPVALAGLCLVPYVEAGSVVLQVVSFKATGRRVFKMSPIHHHFELSGWPEQRVVWTFWGLAVVAAAATVLFAVMLR